MKRRTADCGKLRRPIKRRIPEGIYGSTFLYVRFLMVWALVLLADFILDFRFEYLWPFWLLMRSVYDSFKYQGLAFSVFFVCIAVTSDVICYLLVPVQWLFFAASTYVWVQYVWHTERGVCLPTVFLWLLFVYIEASVRLRDFKTSLPFHLDLCRPFAAHCIGYPVVTLGFGFKSYVSYRLRLRKQRDVQRDNEFYVHLLAKALPTEMQQPDKQKALPSKSIEEEISVNSAAATASQQQYNNSSSTCASSSASSSSLNSSCSSSPASTTPANNRKPSGSPAPSSGEQTKADTAKPSSTTRTSNKDNNNVHPDLAYLEQTPPPPSCGKQRHQNNLNQFFDEDVADVTVAKGFKQQMNGALPQGHKKLIKETITANGAPPTTGKRGKSNLTANNYANLSKEELCTRLEGDIKRLKADLQSSRNCEQELRSQINQLALGDKSQKSQLNQLTQDNEQLQQKLHNLVTARQQDKQNLASVERKLADERKAKSAVEVQLDKEKKAKSKDSEASQKALQALQNRTECSDACKQKRKELDNEIKQLRRENKLREDQIKQMEREAQTLRQYKESQTDSEVLISALQAMQEKNGHLETSLSAETRLKLDLFSALGEAKRQIEIQQDVLMRMEQEKKELLKNINEKERKLNAQFAEVMAVMPATTGHAFSGSPITVQDFAMLPMTSMASGNVSPVLSPCLPNGHQSPAEMKLSQLNPNANDYTPSTPN